ncbi:hypothetical protein A4X13_0g5985 [Tilletia indica]|uniref:Uncharacterized protein n=1 Tax=Tilletia indica TaxID=43049 RepID=A0A8T8SQC9_9BASI|nr:hypothetical protein A4X13_0g5985 [Tilletia indica]
MVERGDGRRPNGRDDGTGAGSSADPLRQGSSRTVVSLEDRDIRQEGDDGNEEGGVGYDDQWPAREDVDPAVRGLEVDNEEGLGSGSESGEERMDIHSDRDEGELQQGEESEALPHIGATVLQDLLDRDVPLLRAAAQVRPAERPTFPPLTEVEKDSLDHYMVHVMCGHSQRSYVEDARVYKKKHKVDLLTLHMVKKLAARRSGLNEETLDMCVGSCIAYTGGYADLRSCSYCRADRLEVGGTKAVKTFRFVSLLPRLRSLYRDPQWSIAMRYQVERAAAAADNGDSARLSDIGDSSLKLAGGPNFNDRDCIVAISTDGSQLIAHRKHSTGWLVLVQILSLPPAFRFSLEHHHCALLIPGPSEPKDIQSFMRPLYEELAKLSVNGAWVWDGLRIEWFKLHVYLAGLFADQKGTPKFSKHIEVLGSIKATSQATCERYIGRLKKSLTQFAEPYALLTNSAKAVAQATLIKISSGVLPPVPSPSNSERRALSFAVPLRRRHASLSHGDEGSERAGVGIPEYGALRGAPCSTYDSDWQYADVIHFMAVKRGSTSWDLAFVRSFDVQERKLTFAVGSWSGRYALIDVRIIREIIGIFSSGDLNYAVPRSTWSEGLDSQDEDDDEDEDLDGDYNFDNGEDDFDDEGDVDLA